MKNIMNQDHPEIPTKSIKADKTKNIITAGSAAIGRGGEFKYDGRHIAQDRIPRVSRDDNKVNININSWCDTDRRTYACWGDYWVKEQLIESLKNQFGDSINLHVEPSQADVTIYMFGSPYTQTPTRPLFYNPNTYNMVWFYSHPEKMDMYETRKYDYMFCASSKFIDTMSTWATGQCEVDPNPLFACTDLRPKLPTNVVPDEPIDVLFVGNARGGSEYGRKAIYWLKGCPEEWSIFLYGAKWERHQYSYTNEWYKGRYFPYDNLSELYGKALVNLIDGHDNMRNEGFVSAKVFDTLACNAWVVMEYNDGVEEIFGKDVLMFKTQDEMIDQIKWSLDERNQKEIAIKMKKLSGIAQKYNYDYVAKRMFNKIKELI